MRRAMLLSVAIAAIALVPSRTPANGASPPQAQQQEDQRARPRSSQPPARQAVPRREEPQRVLPPRYHTLPRPYHFPPIGRQRGFYYHPYFGFYFGPYYGPFYPYPGPYLGSDQYSACVLKTKVKPNTTMVYVNGYYAGEADDFDGLFQGLYLPSGEHDFDFFLEGYRTFSQHLYMNAGESREIAHQMQPLGPGETSAPPLAPRSRLERPMPVTTSGDRPASPLGILAIRVDPPDATIVVDDDAIPGVGAGAEVIVHLASGWHDLEVRRDGYATFRTKLELSEGGTTRLNVKLVR